MDIECIEKHQGYVVEVWPPRDFFEDSALPALEWLLRDSPALTREDKLRELLAAQAAVGCASWWEARQRCMPHVGYDVGRDTHYFIFKIDNNGTTFIVRPDYEGATTTTGQWRS